MALTKTREIDLDVVTAAQQRIINAFSTGAKIYLACSGGKDSIVMMDITYKLIQAGRINPQQLEAFFIDEEAMYDDVIEIVKIWRRRFMSVGAKFTWYCMEYRQMNCLHSLEEAETFVCWDRFQRDKWCRPMPPFAVTSHPLLKPREEVYQKFTERLTKDGINMLGVRVTESLQRRKNVANRMGGGSGNGSPIIYPIYDFRDADIWLYIKENGLEFPKVYMDMYAVGVYANRLRISNFFGVDSCAVLSKLYEFRPELAEAVNRREPNAYIAQMYWDTEMFHRSTRRRKQLEEGEEQKDYKPLVLEICKNPESRTTNEHAQKIIGQYKALVLRYCAVMENADWRRVYEALLTGDPKCRTLRALNSTLRKRVIT